MTALFSLVGKGSWIGTVRLASVDDAGTAVAQSLDSPEEPFSIAEQDAELFEVAFRHLREHIGIDGILSEYWFILLKSDCSQPVANAHHLHLAKFRRSRRIVASSVSCPGNAGIIPLCSRRW